MNHDYFRQEHPPTPDQKVLLVDAFATLTNTMRINYMQHQLETALPEDAAKEYADNEELEHSVYLKIVRLENEETEVKHIVEHADQVWKVTLYDTSQEFQNPVGVPPFDGVTIEFERIDDLSIRRIVYTYEQALSKVTEQIFKSRNDIDAVVVDSKDISEMIIIGNELAKYGVPINGDDIAESFGEMLKEAPKEQPKKVGILRTLGSMAVRPFKKK